MRHKERILKHLRRVVQALKTAIFIRRKLLNQIQMTMFTFAILVILFQVQHPSCVPSMIEHNCNLIWIYCIKLQWFFFVARNHLK